MNKRNSFLAVSALMTLSALTIGASAGTGLAARAVSSSSVVLQRNGTRSVLIERKQEGGSFKAIAQASARTYPLTESPGDTTYYVDDAGDDSQPGTSAGTAWKTVTRLNAVKFAPGDKILLKAGCEFAGPIVLQGSGIPGKPIVIDRYGDGAAPVVAGQGEIENTIRLHNQQHWEIRNLTITNTDGGGWDDEGRVIRRALYVTAEDAGDIEYIHLKDLEIRDVRGMYRFKGNQANGGIICQVTGKTRKTRFVDLRIEDCVFRTKSIDRYPVVVTSSWKREPACEVVWKNNTLDHSGRAHIVMPADAWPRMLVYYFDPEVRKVFPLKKTAAPMSPFTGRIGCEDIFSEMAARLKRSWSFFEATRVKEGAWLFANQPGGMVHHVDDGAKVSPTYPLAFYGELRAFGFVPPWLDADDPSMKMICAYGQFGWQIPEPKTIINFHLSHATDQAGFEGSGCSAFNQMHPLAAILRQYPELAGYRGEEIDRYTAMTFVTFLNNWNEKTDFYGGTWLGKHNNGVPLFMAHLMLDLPIMRVSTVYNWREGPITTRGKDGAIKRNKVTYQTKGFPFGG